MPRAPDRKKAPVAETGAGTSEATHRDDSLAPTIEQQATQGDRFLISMGEHVGASDPQEPSKGRFEPQVSLSREKLVEMLTTHRVRTNKDGAYFTRSMGGDGKRSDANAQPWPLVPFDIDDLQSDEMPLLERWVDESKLAGFLYSTFSHQPDKPKARLIFIASRAVTPEEHAFLHEAMAARVPFKIDPCMRKPSQPIFLPACRAESLPHAIAREIKGNPLDVELLLASQRDEIEAEQRRRADRMQGIGTGVRQPGGVIEYFNQRFDMRELLTLHGYKAKGRNRFTATASKSRRAAVVLYDRAVISFHEPAHDPLAVRNKSHQAVLLDAFAAYCKLEHGDDFKAAFKGALTWAQAQGWEDPTAAPTRRAWPADLGANAHHGIAGEIVQLLAPHTEADPAAILLLVLVWFGAAVGRGPRRGPCYRVEGDRHYVNLFAVLVGDTAKGRKDTARGRVRQVFDGADMHLEKVSGLSSGEGLIWAVRDPIHRQEQDKKTKKLIQVLVDAGVLDKRLLVSESEFVGVLKQGARAGNTLSPVIRTAWDTGDVQSLTKNSPAKATDAHIAITGHITVQELQRELTATESANGFANRFLFMLVRRSKVLPFGGQEIDPKIISGLSQRLAGLITKAKLLGPVSMTDAARALWVQVYPTLSEGLPGLVGAVTARAEAQCVRLALTYALLDGASAIDAPHLRAALAVWKRCEDSARFIFGHALGDPTADEILRALRAAGDAGMSRTDMSHDIFKRHKSSAEIEAALQHLSSRGLAHSSMISTGGRAAEVWKASAAR
jgi:hypothetical protein